MDADALTVAGDALAGIAEALAGNATAALYGCPVIAGSGGDDTVTDFDGSGGDRVQITGNANGAAIDSFAELQAVASSTSDGGVLIALETGNSLKLAAGNAGNRDGGTRY